ncbi:hypothetical protein NDU88_004679 [Pleurodeles waltl]|uniref:Uncharacterized protein n=1 Tax=Pleurodeles waltl TaxID=8319 RepID=A0AAV7MVL7_PLEWA|nr:hypothetical protein NDU88_004679 [Pleurodeles waltl]
MDASRCLALRFCGHLGPGNKFKTVLAGPKDAPMSDCISGFPGKLPPSGRKVAVSGHNFHGLPSLNDAHHSPGFGCKVPLSRVVSYRRVNLCFK